LTPALGQKHSEVSKRKISEAKRGLTPWNKGKTGIYSEETLRKIGDASRRRKYTEETRRRMSEAHRGKKRLPFSEDHKRRISESKRGENHPMFGKKFSAERRVKISDSLRGRKHTEGHRRNNADAQCGKKLSEETKLKISEAFRGENHPNWQGGKSFEPYGLEFNSEIRQQIRERDNFTCQECNYTEDQLGRTLSIHHIDYDKRNNDPENLVSLCNSCHSQTNFSRADWTEYFKERKRGIRK